VNGPGRSARRVAAVAIACGLLAAACGGGSKKASNANSKETTTTAPETASGAVEESTTTTAAGAATGGATPTTVSGTSSAGRSTATTAKKSSSTSVTVFKKQTPNTQPALLNVVATTSTTAGGPVAQPGGSMTVAVAADTAGFDPAKASSASTATEGPRDGAIFDVLFYQDSQTYDLVAQLAAGMTSTDGKVWDMKLRPNVKFSDGTVLDANAVKFNYQRIQDVNNASPVRSTALGMTDMTVVDPLTLRITLAAVNGQFPRVIANQLPFIGSPTAIQKQGAADFNVHPVGAGPFLLKEYVQGDHTLLVRNPGYWNAPQPFLDQINIRIIPDDTQRYNSLIAGEIQAGRVNRPQDVPAAAKVGFGAALAILNGGNDLIFNNSKPPFNDKRFRKAVSEAIDINAFSQAVEGGASIPATTLFQQSSALYENIPLSKYDKADAANLFKQVFQDNGNQKVEFTIIASQGKSSQSAEFFQGQLSQSEFSPYVKVNVQTVTTPVLVSGAVSGNYQAQVWANLPLDPEPNIYNSFHSGLSTNFNRYNNPALDAALETGRTSLDAAARKAAYKTVQQIFADDVPSYFYVRNQQGFLFSPKVHDFKVFEDGTPLWDRVWIEH
jgi:peptide/nickel transport system substrate-binding protein